MREGDVFDSFAHVSVSRSHNGTRVYLGARESSYVDPHRINREPDGILEAHRLTRMDGSDESNGFEESQREARCFSLAARPASVECRRELDRSAPEHLMDQVLGGNVRFLSKSVCVQ